MPTKRTQSQFVALANQVHGNKYDYAQTVYINSVTKVSIVCPKHGAFEQAPMVHLQKHGCSKCSRRGSTDKFIEKARAVHGDKYDYSEAIYEHVNLKLRIICAKHGMFEQSAASHLNGLGCAMCGAFRRGLAKRSAASNSFIDKARAVHGDKYDYSQSEYTTVHANISIVCPQHGLFKQEANAHLRGSGCCECSRRRSADSRRYTQADFLRKAYLLHGDKFDYSQADYQGAYSKITIICPEHGPFLQAPCSHLWGGGCRKCAGTFPHDTASFIAQARKVHGDKYFYHETVYTGSHIKVVIGCPKHGSFKQQACNHIQGARCPKCTGEVGCSWIATNWAAIQGERLASLYVVRLSSEGEQFYKIGITLNPVEKRFRPNIRMPYLAEIIAVFSSSDAVAIHKTEAIIKKGFKALRYRPNKRFGGYTECFSEVEPILAALPFGTVFYS